MMGLGAIRDDDVWWSSTYSGKASQPNCIVGEAFDGSLLLLYYSEADAGVGVYKRL